MGNTNIGKSKLSGSPEKALSLKLKKGSVTNEKLADKAVTSGKIANNAITSEKVAKGQLNWTHLDKDTQNIIASREEGGVALSGEFGESTLIGIHQKKLSETFTDIRSQLNTVLQVNFSADPYIVYTGTSSIYLVATTDIEASEIKIRDNDAVIAEGGGHGLSCTKSINPSQSGDISFYASFVINGMYKTAETTVSVVDRIYYGSGMIYTDATTSPTPRLTPEGSYNVEVTEDGRYIFFNIPTSMMLNGATMNGIDFPLDEPTTVTIDNTEYKSYRSSNTVDAGTYEIIIS